MMVVESSAVPAPKGATDPNEARLIKWTTEQFHQMGDAGLFEGKHVELIEGEIIEMSPMGSLHVVAVMKAARVLERVFGHGFHARTQAPLNLNLRTDPEPDIIVVTGEIEAYKDAHPDTALLVVEVSDTTLTRDRTHKASLYARAEIMDYWIINLVDDQLEVHRQPEVMQDQLYGYGYAQASLLKRGDSISPLGAPQTTLEINSLLP